ncbi:MAG TPA: TAXI family TRAP transporter solute-binding subunit [Bacillota bacterium]|nr:TAXI family TRAP transporter solute-binding subunit [Bacillota bacterium]
MRKKGLLSMLVLTLGLSLFVLGCGRGTDQGLNHQANKPTDQQQYGTPDSIIIATGGTSGTYYSLGAGIAKIFTEKAQVNASVQSTSNSIENMRVIKKRQVDLALTKGDIADYASKGVNMFKESGAIKNLKVIASLYNETIQIVVAKNSTIRTIQDLKGKRVAIGAFNSGIEANAEQLLEIYGIKFSDLGKTEYLDFGEASSHLQDGSIDAAFITAPAPIAAVNELAITKGIRIIGLDAEHMKQLIQKYPYYVEQPILKGTYPGFDQEVQTVAVKTQLVARSELDEAMVYHLTKTLFENLDQMKKIQKQAEQIKLETALEGVSLELHSGAVKYYQEKGIKK